MRSYLNFQLRLILLLILHQGSTASSRPDAIPEAEEITLNEGDVLQINCTSSSPIKFYYPTSYKIFTSTPLENEIIENGTYKYVFTRAQTVHGDTGWYGCASQEAEGNLKYHNDTNVNWKYVYVSSEKNLFVGNSEMDLGQEYLGGTIVLPCRPTSRNTNVSLSKDMQLIPLDERITYDPRAGFTVKNLSLMDEGLFECQAIRDNMEEVFHFYVKVIAIKIIPNPYIYEDTLHHVILGQTLYVNCSVFIPESINYDINWTSPRQSERITIRNYYLNAMTNSGEAISELIIRNVTQEDEGEYECYVYSFRNRKGTKINITVNDPSIKFINLTLWDSESHHRVMENDYVLWKVRVVAHPYPVFRWLNPKGEEIQGDWSSSYTTDRYAIRNVQGSTTLRVNLLNAEDMGQYTLQAINSYVTETLNVTLEVMIRPVLIMNATQPYYYTPDEITEIYCGVAAYPLANITCDFLACPDYPSYENGKTIYTMNNFENISMTEIKSTIKFPITMSGYLSCLSCNLFGCDSRSEGILVSEVKDGFGLIKSDNIILEGDNLNITCAASIYNYTNQVKWVDERNNQLIDYDGRKIIANKTRFTYQSILQFNNINVSDSGKYYCIGKDSDGLHSIDYEIIVHKLAAPYIHATNMNGTERVVHLGEQDHKLVNLSCYVQGMPVPNITWYRNDIRLEENEQYIFSHNNQELRIQYFFKTDSGKYLCRAENRLGTIESFHLITVKGGFSVNEFDKRLIALIMGLILIVVALLLFFVIKFYREKRMRKELMEAGLMHFEEGALECLNPDLTVDDQAELLPYDKKWEFSRERLKLGKQLGSGAFGVVMKAEARGIRENETITTVAVKMVRRTTDATYVKALASELKILVHLGKHLNVVNLLGACTKNISKRELLVIVEYCRFGNLHNYLLRHRDNFINQIDTSNDVLDPMIGMDVLVRTFSIGSDKSLRENSEPGKEEMEFGTDMSLDGTIMSNNSIQPGWRSNYHGDYKDHNLKPICTQDLLSWAFQVARGMEYLSQRRVLHGDLATRNILLAENNVVKICDFGLAKNMYKDDNYKKQGDMPVPIKWMAIESIRDHIFSTQSDIWSFGIVLWEFFTLGKTPYPGMEAAKQYQKLIEGYRMEKPEYATGGIYDIMLRCWKAKPTLRPSFTELVDSIGDLLGESVKAHYINLNTPYMDMNNSMLNDKNDYLAMMSAPDHTILTSSGHEYVNCPTASPPVLTEDGYLCMSPTSPADESGIFSPRSTNEGTHFNFPSSQGSDSEDALELSPMLKTDQPDNDPYLKPIDVNAKRADFVRQRQAMRNASDKNFERDSGYYNTGKLSENSRENIEENKYHSTILSSPDNYVNMPKSKSELKTKDMPDGFSNPSYILINNRSIDAAKA